MVQGFLLPSCHSSNSSTAQGSCGKQLYMQLWVKWQPWVLCKLLEAS